MLTNFLRQRYSEGRDQTADLLKGFAILMMIQVHLTELFALNEISQSFSGRISLFLGGPPAAPLFMVVMGYYLANSKKSLVQNIKRGLSLIISGILLNIGLNIHLLIRIYSEELPLDPLRYILGADILPLAGLSVIVISFINKIVQKNILIGSIFTVVIIVTIMVAHNFTVEHQVNGDVLIYIQAFLWGSLDWSYFPFLPWAVYPLGGYLYKIFVENNNPESALVETVVLTSAIVTFVSISYGVETSSELKNYYHHDWKYSLWVFQFLILMTYIFKRIERYMGMSTVLIYIKWLGKNVTAAYVVQWLLIGNIATFIFQTQNEIMLIIWFVSVLVITTIYLQTYEKWRTG